MSLDETISDNSIVSMPIEDIKLPLKKDKIPREQLIQEGRVVLTKKLSLGTSVRLKIDVLLGRFKKIKLPHTKERLPEKEKELFKENIDIDILPVGCMIEIWTKVSDSEEYEVTEFQKLK